MGRLGVVVIGPTARLRQDGLGITKLGTGHVVALEGPNKRLRQAVAPRAVRWRRDRDQTEFGALEDGRGRRVLRPVVTAPLRRVRGLQRCLAKAGPERAIHQRSNVGAGQRRRGEATQAGGPNAFPVIVGSKRPVRHRFCRIVASVQRDRVSGALDSIRALTE